MNAFFWKKVGLDFGRTVLGFYGVYIAAGLSGALEAFSNQDFSLATWQPLGLALVVGLGSAVLRAAQARWTTFETPPA